MLSSAASSSAIPTGLDTDITTPIEVSSYGSFLEAEAESEALVRVPLTRRLSVDADWSSLTLMRRPGDEGAEEGRSSSARLNAAASGENIALARGIFDLVCDGEMAFSE